LARTIVKGVSKNDSPLRAPPPLIPNHIESII
jgi:hypothetical protein